METGDVRVVVLAVNLGSPEAPAEAEVRTYLREFLMDANVIDVPRPVRDVIVKGFILPKRPKQSAAAYASIWLDEGSPLIVNTQRLVEKLQDRIPVPVHMAMRYGSPSISAKLQQIMEQYAGLTKLILLPLYPHYAMSTVGTVVDLARNILRRQYPQIELVIHKPFYNDPDYIQNLSERIRVGFPD